MGKAATNPFQPFVTLDQVVKYRPGDPSTSTGEPFIDAFVEAMNVVGAGSGERLARYMQLDQAQISHTLKTLTGHHLSDVRRAWAAAQVERVEAQHPDWGPDKIARHLGYADRSGLWYAGHRPMKLTDNK